MSFRRATSGPAAAADGAGAGAVPGELAAGARRQRLGGSVALDLLLLASLPLLLWVTGFFTPGERNARRSWPIKSWKDQAMSNELRPSS